MAQTDYAFVKNNKVVQIAVFDDPSTELLDHFKQEWGADLVLPATKSAEIGGEYDGTLFWRICLYPSWVKDYEKNTFVPPVPYPSDGSRLVEGGKVYIWDEDSVSWLEKTPEE